MSDEDRWSLASSWDTRTPEWTRRVLIEPGTAPWAAFGVRDPSLLVDAEGTAVVRGGRTTMFFNARSGPRQAGGATVVGRATSSDGGNTWRVDPDPVLSDGSYAAIGSALAQNNNTVVAFYSFDTTLGFRRATGVGDEPLKPVTDEPFLKPADIGCTRVGLPYVTWVNGNWLMVFEGFQARARRFAIFAAQSGDLRDWVLINGGRPLLEPTGWHRHGQANPSLHRDADRLFLLYNGSPEPMEWEVGLARGRVTDPTEWETLGEPILTREKAELWSVTRLEGARPFPSGINLKWLLYFGTPTADPYRGATIGAATLRLPLAPHPDE